MKKIALISPIEKNDNVQKNKKVNRVDWEKVRYSTCKRIFNKIFLEWNTSFELEKQDVCKRQIAQKYITELINKKYVMQERIYTEYKQRPAQRILKVRGNLNPYWDYLSDKDVKVSNEFKEFIELLFESKILRREIVSNTDNIIDGINYFFEFTFLIPSGADSDFLDNSNIDCFIGCLISKKINLKEIMQKFIEIIDEDITLTQKEKFFLICMFLNQVINEGYFQEKLEQEFSKVIPLLKDNKNIWEYYGGKLAKAELFGEKNKDKITNFLKETEYFKKLDKENKEKLLDKPSKYYFPK
ncbi:MAG: hypothetical protein NTU63_01890 [Candidatus Pacearchaeota archaeon]|nr:hypothetical protein [Candidatus Pacearchaeota archaeon]